MDITIVGSGIAGMSAYIWLAGRGHNVKIIGNELGGEFLSGGFKYIPYSDHFSTFMKEMGVEYGLRRINGAVYWHEQVHEFPLVFFKNGWMGVDIQDAHWLKTRGEGHPLNHTCMNDPWSGRTELAIIPEGGMGKFFDIMIKQCRNGFEVMSVDREVIGVLLGQCDLLIYTIPVKPIADYCGVSVRQNHTTLTVLRTGPREDTGRNKAWWDYIYVPEPEPPFHRMTRRADGGYDLEINVNNLAGRSELEVQNAAIQFARNQLNIGTLDFNGGGTMKMKGQLITTVDKGVLYNAIDEQVFLLGRYAQQESRMTWDKVIERLYIDLNKLIQEKMRW